MAQKLNVPLYDLDQWRSLMQGGLLEIFLKGHLWLERLLDDYLKVAAENPDALGIERMTFVNKLKLCHAFGLLSGDHVRIFKKVNKLRNEVAHEITAQIEWDIADTLLGESTALMRSVYEAMEEVAPPHSISNPPSRLNRWFFTVVSDIGLSMLRFNYEQIYKTELLAFAAVHVSREMDGRPPVSDERAREIANLPAPPDPGHVWGIPRSPRLTEDAD